MKKKISFLVVMLLGLFVFSHESKAETYYFDNTNTQWEHVSVWSWSDGLDQLWQMNNNFSAWPGIELTKDDASGYYVWEACGELPSDGAVMYNNGGEGVENTEHTCDALAYEAYGNAGKVCVPTVKNTAEDEENNPKRKEGLWYGEWKNYDDEIGKRLEIRGNNWTEITHNSIAFEWEKNEFADGYIIRQSIDGIWVDVEIMEGNETVSYKASGLVSATEYHFSLIAYKDINGQRICSLRTVYLGASTLNIPPSSVTNVVCNSRTKDSIVLKWDANLQSDGYVVEMYKSGSGKWEVVKTISDNTLTTITVNNMGLKPSTVYKFRVKSYLVYDRINVYSDMVEIAVKTLPESISALTYRGSFADNLLTLSWGTYSSADGYIVQQYIDGEWKTIKNIKDNKIGTYDLTNLKPSTIYDYLVKAYTRDGDNILYGDAAEVTIKTFPSEMLGVTCCDRTANSITLKWDKNTSADGYKINQYKDGMWVCIKTITDNKIAKYKVTGLGPAKTNKFTVYAYKMYNKTICFGKSVTKSVKTLPSTVKGFTFSGRTASTVTLKWTKNTSAEGYVIQQYKSGKWKTIKTIAGNSTVKYKVTGLKPSVNYKFRIKAYTKDGSTKLYSASYSTKSVKTVPSTVKGFTYKSRTAKTITLKWYKNNSADGYLIQQYKGGKWVTIKTITKKSTVNYKVTGLKKNTSYKFRIKAYKKDNSKKLYSVSYSNRTVKTLKK